ncbi:protein of unknown function [Candidatus Hydrogenisulfobacillus filiaventi]|uniref:Uncharacterized protein n=1 Tax=Candidatus Hydrogenisulfobacillus filiaventi TaxID=2707344 RepID=A0A6F8ZEE1_9FIRM|nr:protein of unknown function [Candidatus Hydrogenisulfobacillus filiaventi]
MWPGGLAREGYLALAAALYTGARREAMAPDRIPAGMAIPRTAPPDRQRDPAPLGDARNRLPGPPHPHPGHAPGTPGRFYT